MLDHRRLVVVSNRAPVELRKRPGGSQFVSTVGGLVSALVPVFEAAGGGLWVAWAGADPADERSALPPRLRLPTDKPFFDLRRVRIAEADLDAYYYGFCNRGLWPLSHYFVGRCQFRLDEWQSYRRVNETFAQTVLEEQQSDDLIWVQDFHLTLVPALVRDAKPDAKLGLFWHVPFPEPSVFGILPWRAEVLLGLLGCDVIGFHLESYARNFLACVERFLGVPVDFDRNEVTIAGRCVRVVAWPIGIDAREFERLARRPEMASRVARIRAQLGSEHVILGVDRLDYTKGILERLQGFERFLERWPGLVRKITFVQIAVPSREGIDAYRRMKKDIDEAVGRISGRFTTEGWVPIRYIYGSVPPGELVAYYMAADLALVTPLRDGMNLIAKEYVATCIDDDGALILSEFAGAADDLPEAIQVNPYNVDDVAEQIHAALTMSAADRRTRMAALRRHVRERDIRWWLERVLAEFDAEEPSERTTLTARKG